MDVDQDRLEREAHDAYTDHIITGSIYCGSCGYNLKTLPYVYTCPECGNEYNARPLHMHGIFTPHAIEFPFGASVGAMACTLGAVFVGYIAVRSPRIAPILLAMLLVAATILLMRDAYVRMKQYLKAREIARYIAATEEG